MKRGLLMLMVLGALVGASPAAASDHFNPSEVFREVRCVTCGTTLDVSNAPSAQRMKDFILVRWRQGWSKERVIDALAVEFGEDVRATPPASGWGLVAWLVPIGAAVIAVVVLVVVLRVWVRRRRDAGDDEPPELPAEDGARVDRELERLPEL